MMGLKSALFIFGTFALASSKAFPSCPCGSTEIEKPVVIPEAPVLPALGMPKILAPAIVEYNAPKPIAQPRSYVMPLPELPVTAVVEEPVVIPEAPVLPPMKMPELPTIVDTVPCGPTIIEEPVVIPEAPMLPALVIPKLPPPAIYEYPPKPIMPALPVVGEPLLIPEELMLPSLSEIPPRTIVETPMLGLELVAIPGAPVLPPFTMPELPKPAVVEVQPGIPESHPHHHFPSVIVKEPIVIPEAPVLPPMVLPELPSTVVIEESIKEHKIERPVLIPTAPTLLQLPCV